MLTQNAQSRLNCEPLEIYSLQQGFFLSVLSTNVIHYLPCQLFDFLQSFFRWQLKKANYQVDLQMKAGAKFYKSCSDYIFAKQQDKNFCCQLPIHFRLNKNEEKGNISFTSTCLTWFSILYIHKLFFIIYLHRVLA